MTTAERYSDEELRSMARGIVMGELVIPDYESRDWQISLALILTGGLPEDTGQILVPMSPHLGGRWLNGKVPALTTKIFVIPKDQMDELQDLVHEMFVALWGEDEPDG